MLIGCGQFGQRVVVSFAGALWSTDWQNAISLLVTNATRQDY